MAIMRIVKNNNFSIVSNAIIGDKMSRKVGRKGPLTLGTKCPQKKLKGVGQNVERKSDTVRKK